MPRQPFLPTYKNSQFRFGPGNIDQIPAISNGVGRCIMYWSYVDVQMALLLSSIMKADSEASIAVFLTLKNARAQREVLVSAANTTLSGRDLQAFHALMNIYQGLQAQRADIAHGIFSASDDIPDGAIWIESKNHTKGWIEMISGFGKTAKEMILSKKIAPLNADDLGLKRDTFVYKITDLERLCTDIKELWLLAFKFTQHLRHPHFEIASEGFEQLWSSPQIQREISLMNEAQKNNPEASP